jgi:hypothetical protein
MRAFPLVLVALFCGTLGASATTCAELNKLWSDSYWKEFQVRLPKREFSCPESPDYKIARAIHDLRAVDNEYYFKLFQFFTSEIVIAPECDGKHRVAQTDRWGTVTLCPLFFAQGSRAWRASVLHHESAHVNYYDPGHVECDHGIHKGKPACDAAIADGGNDGSGYNWQLRYLKAAERGAPGNDLEKKVIRKIIEALLANSFNMVTEDDKRVWFE